jgi:hypothetical protein
MGRIINNFIVLTLYQTVLRYQNEAGYDGGACRMHGSTQHFSQET